MCMYAVVFVFVLVLKYMSKSLLSTSNVKERFERLFTTLVLGLKKDLNMKNENRLIGC